MLRYWYSCNSRVCELRQDEAEQQVGAGRAAAAQRARHQRRRRAQQAREQLREPAPGGTYLTLRYK